MSESCLLNLSTSEVNSEILALRSTSSAFNFLFSSVIEDIAKSFSFTVSSIEPNLAVNSSISDTFERTSEWSSANFSRKELQSFSHSVKSSDFSDKLFSNLDILELKRSISSDEDFNFKLRFITSEPDLSTAPESSSTFLSFSDILSIALLYLPSNSSYSSHLVS